MFAGVDLGATRIRDEVMANDCISRRLNSMIKRTPDQILLNQVSTATVSAVDSDGAILSLMAGRIHSEFSGRSISAALQFVVSEFLSHFISEFSESGNNVRVF